MKTILILPALLAVLATGCDTAERAQAAEPASPASAATTNAASPTAAPWSKSGATNGPTQTATNALALPQPPPELPAPVQDVVQLAQNTLGEQVLVDFVATIETPYSLTAEHVIYLKDLGVSETVIASLLKRQVALGGAAVELPEDPAATASADTDAPTGPKLALTNAPGANVGLAAAPALPPQPVPNAPTQGETPGTAPAVAPEPTTTVNYNVFHQTLSPYGTWVEVGDYGWCWQPTVSTISVGWRPYSDNGRWVWSASGWYWNSYYSWGWAPFHYGRWCNVPARGWCWVPGTTWGPSWVSWRHSDDYFGWAPLPPACGWASGIGLTYHGAGISVGFTFGLGASDYCFVPRHRFYDPHCYRFRAPGRELTGLYHRSSVVNNYIVGNNNTVIINNGVGRDVVQKHTREEIRPLALADARQPGRAGDLANRPGGRSERLEVYRPVVAADAASSRPPATILARQEARPQVLSSRSSAAGSGLGIGNNVSANRPFGTTASRSDVSGGGSGRQETRPDGAGLVPGRTPTTGNRPSVVPGRDRPAAGSRPGTPSVSRPEPRASAQADLENPTSAVQLHGRSESRPSVVSPRSDNLVNGNPRTAVGVRNETRPVASSPDARVVPSPSQPAPVQSAPVLNQPAAPRPVYGRAESRPLPQQQVQVRRDTPAYVRPQPTVPGGQSSFNRPDVSARYTPAPAPRAQPSFTPAPAPSQPAFQPRYEPRPQIQQPTAPAARSYSPPVSSSQGAGSDRSGGSSRPSPSRNQQP